MGDPFLCLRPDCMRQFEDHEDYQEHCRVAHPPKPQASMKEKRTAVALRLPRSLVARLDQVCDERVVGRNLIVTKAVEEFLDRLPPVENR